MASLGKRSELRGDAESPETRQLSPPVEEILDRKAVCGLDYCLVKWKGLPVHAATWEPLEEVAKACDSATLLVRKASAVGPRLLGSSQRLRMLLDDLGLALPHEDVGAPIGAHVQWLVARVQDEYLMH